MNFCLQDAFNLGWKLAAAVTRGIPDEALDTYETERRPTIEDHLDNVRRQTALQFNYSEELVALKRFIECQLIPMESVNRLICNDLAGLSARYSNDVNSIVGARLRDMQIHRNDGAPTTSIHALLRNQRFVLLDLTGGPVPDLPPNIVRYVERVSARIDDRRGLAGAASLLLRPDGHVAWASNHPTAHEMPSQDLVRWFL